MVLTNISKICEPVLKEYDCMLKDLLDIEAKLKAKEDTKILSGKYQPFIEKCMGGDVNKLLGNLYANFGKSLRLSKKTQMFLDTPKEGFITKIYPKEKDMIMTSYRPAEKKTKYYRKLIKFVDNPRKSKKREANKNNSNRVRILKSKKRRLKKTVKKLRRDKELEESKDILESDVNDVLDSDSNTNSEQSNTNSSKTEFNSSNNSQEEFVFRIKNPLNLFKSKTKSRKRNSSELSANELVEDKRREREKKIDIAISNSISQF